MRKLAFALIVSGILAIGTSHGVEKVSGFEALAPDVPERMQAALMSSAFRNLQQEFKKRGVAGRFLTDGAYTAPFTNPKDKKEYFLTAVPIVSHFPTVAPPLAALIVSDGKEFQAGWLEMKRDPRRGFVCSLESGGKQIAQPLKMELLPEPPLGVERGKAAIAITKNPEKDDVILILCRSPYPAKREKDLEGLAVIFYSGDLVWGKSVSLGGSN